MIVTNRSLRALAVLAALSALLITGCSAMRLSEEAKPQTGFEEFFVARADFRTVVIEAEIWTQGVIRSARAGDPRASEYLKISHTIQIYTTSAHRIITGVEDGMRAGTVTDDIASVQAALIANIILEVQAELLAGQGYGSL